MLVNLKISFKHGITYDKPFDISNKSWMDIINSIEDIINNIPNYIDKRKKTVVLNCDENILIHISKEIHKSLNLPEPLEKSFNNDLTDKINHITNNKACVYYYEKFKIFIKC